IAILIGFLIAIATNADTFYMVSRLSKDTFLRSTISQAADQVVMTQVVSQLNLESMMQISAPTRAAQMSAAQVQWRVKEVGGEHCPAIDLLTYWQPELSGRPLPATAIAIQIRPTSDTAPFYVLADKLIGQQDLAIEPFPSPMETPQGILGLSLQPNGRLIPVLEGTSFILPAIAPPAQSLHPAVAIAMNQMSEPVAGSVTGSVTDSGYPLTRSMEADPATPTILVVDDAALMRRRLSASLSAYGYRVESCADGLEAWNWLRSHPQPALMITDIEMPYLDGFSLTDRCRKSEMTQPILVISSRLAEEWSLEAKRVGATDFLTKGFSTSELLRKVEQLLNPVLTPS
ncbi:MAG: response regulator, partial [Synechococcales cyanobacterium RU_4_20]|nr:response regulator [Synechococcales cyanobacterium RU_4_20]